MKPIKGITCGYELELGDINRNRTLPARFGAWEYAECDIVNIHGPYAGIACDPLGTHPPYGGEINMYPSKNTGELASRIMDTISHFRDNGDHPSASCVNHGHVHIRVPGLRDNIHLLKRLTKYIMKHQAEVIEKCYQYEEHPDMAQCKTARTYLKWDGGRPMPLWMGQNIIDKAENFDDFIRIQCCGKDGVSRGRPFRYAINTYCLKHTDTIEFRCFRASLDYEEIKGSINFAHDFVTAALYGLSHDYEGPFPAFEFNLEHYLGWEATKWPKERGKKERTYVEI